MRRGFTLAEVLITLGIIGVVAAMTMPSLINNTQGKELEAAFKKSFSVCSQALEMMKIDNGGVIYPADYPARTFAKEYSKYFSSLAYSGTGSINAGSVDEEGTPHESARIFKQYKIYSGTKNIKTDIFDDGQFRLKDGSFFMIENNGFSKKIFITVDVNGERKRPNVYGRDLFSFELTQEGKLLPMGTDGTTYTDMERYCSKTSSDNLNGIACAYKAFNEPTYFSRRF